MKITGYTQLKPEITKRNEEPQLNKAILSSQNKVDVFTFKAKKKSFRDLEPPSVLSSCFTPDTEGEEGALADELNNRDNKIYRLFQIYPDSIDKLASFFGLTDGNKLKCKGAGMYCLLVKETGEQVDLFLTAEYDTTYEEGGDGFGGTGGDYGNFYRK